MAATSINFLAPYIYCYVYALAPKKKSTVFASKDVKEFPDFSLALCITSMFSAGTFIFS